jgi:hypothetical protein
MNKTLKSISLIAILALSSGSLYGDTAGKDKREDKRGDRQDNRGEKQDGRKDNRDEKQEGRQDNRDGRQDNRQGK